MPRNLQRRQGGGPSAQGKRSGVSITLPLPFPLEFVSEGAVIVTFLSERATWRNFNTYDGVYHFKGQWANGGKGVKNRYLGLKFQVSGKTHFGWARLNVAFKRHLGFFAVLTGYAYETIPNKPIIAGKTKGPGYISAQEPDAALIMPTSEPATLGALAMGAPGLSIWRRKESLASTLGRKDVL